MRQVHCNECGKYTSTIPKYKNHPRGIHEVYFKCDHCFWHYTVAVTNNRARKLQRIMKQKGIQYIGEEYVALDPETGEDVLIKKSKEQIELDEIMDRLKFNMINYGVA